MSSLPIPFKQLVHMPERHYGRPKPPIPKGPLELILWENVAYLANDEKRAAAFQALRTKVGTRPEQILAASDDTLFEIAKAGIVPHLTVKKLRHIAQIAHYVFKGDLHSVLKKPFPEARKEIRKFPSLGEPGAERVLLFSGAYPVLALESNGMRALLRLGYGEEHKNYSATYRSVQKALEGNLPQDCGFLVRAHQLLRQHGKEICRPRPLCDECFLKEKCQYFRRLSKK